MRLIIAGSRTVSPTIEQIDAAFADMCIRMVARDKPVRVIPMRGGRR